MSSTSLSWAGGQVVVVVVIVVVVGGRAASVCMFVDDTLGKIAKLVNRRKVNFF